MKELDKIKNEFKSNHAARMDNLQKAIESLEKAQKPEPKETKNTKKIGRLNDLLASL